MKKLSDYKGDEAIELWADLLDPISTILTDEGVRKAVQSGQPKITIVKEILKNHKKEAIDVMLRIDPEPIDAINLVLRLAGVVADLGKYPGIKSFFGYAEEGQTDSESGGLPTANTGGAKK